MAQHTRATRAAADQFGVLSRRQLSLLGVDRRAIARHVQAGRWRTHGSQTVAVHTAGLSVEAQWHRAVWEVGERIAVLDGVSALAAAGLRGLDDTFVHVSVPHTATVDPIDGVVIHKVIRRVSGEQTGWPVARTTPAVAAIRAAHWAVSDRQAALFLVMPVQQRLTTGARLLETAKIVRGRTRRAFIPRVCADIAGGAQALGELDFALLCRQAGLPEPERQVVRAGPEGRIYLDVRWPCGLVVEIDGAGHQFGLAPTDDNLRQNAVTLGGDLVLRFDLLALRVFPDQVVAQVRQGLARAGGL